jgi:hypothetical protein
VKHVVGSGEARSEPGPWGRLVRSTQEIGTKMTYETLFAVTAQHDCRITPLFSHRLQECARRLGHKGHPEVSKIYEIKENSALPSMLVGVLFFVYMLIAASSTYVMGRHKYSLEVYRGKTSNKTKWHFMARVLVCTLTNHLHNPRTALLRPGLA